MFIISEYGRKAEKQFNTLREVADFYYDDREVSLMIDDRYKPVYIPEVGYVKISKILKMLNKKAFNKIREQYIISFYREIKPVLKRAGEAFWGGYIIKKTKDEVIDTSNEETIKLAIPSNLVDE